MADWTPMIREVGPREDLQPVPLRVRGLAWSGTLDTAAWVGEVYDAGISAPVHQRLLVTVGGEDIIADFRTAFGGDLVKGTVTLIVDDGGTSTNSGIITVGYGNEGDDESACSDPDCCVAHYQNPWTLKVDGHNQHDLWEGWNDRRVTVLLQGYALTRYDIDSPDFDPDVEAQLALPRDGHKPGEWLRMPRSKAESLARGGAIVREYAPGESIADRVAAMEDASLPSWSSWLAEVSGDVTALRERVSSGLPGSWRAGAGPSVADLQGLQGLWGSLRVAAELVGQLGVDPAVRSLSGADVISEGTVSATGVR